jgi:phosphatidylinositol alpha-mannosyltransferase
VESTIASAHHPPNGPGRRRPLRIGLFAPYDLASDGGVTTHVRAQARALAARGHWVSVYGPASHDLRDGEMPLGRAIAIRYGGTESGLSLDWRTRRTVARLFASAHFDVVHLHEPLVPLMPWFVLRCAASTGTAIVGTFHVHRERGHTLYPIARPWLRPLVHCIDHRIAVSEAARRTVAAHFPGAYEIVPNGVELDAFRSRRARPPHMSVDHRHVLYVGRLEPRKGVDHLVHAMAFVHRVCPRSRLIVVGDGPDRGALAALAQSLGVDACFTGRLGDDDVVAHLQAADVVCSPATGGESFGIVLLEAMACGKAIVASRIDGYEEVLGDGECGRLVAPGDARALGQAVAMLLASGEQRDALGARARSAAGRFDWTVIAARLDDIYQRLAARSMRDPLDAHAHTG